MNEPLEPVEERDLGGKDLRPRRMQVEPADAIDLTELAEATGPRWHSISKELLAAVAGSSSPASAQATTVFPPRCRTSPSSSIVPSGGMWPVSSANSRRATVRNSSPGSASPFSTVQDPSSFFAKNGSPG